MKSDVPQAIRHPSRKGCWFWAGWEPDRYYQRIGARATPFFGNGDWIKDWRARLESKDCLEAVRDAGGSILITRFSKGFGRTVDGRDWDSLKCFVERAHSLGLKVWGYLQGQSLFGEFIFPENPEAVEWVSRTFDGKPQTWGVAYNRFAPCLSSGGYLEMVKQIVAEGVSRIRLDGIHIDNIYYKHCYCPRCKSLFREWLAARGDLECITGIECADFVEPPPLADDADMLPDPLAILWIEFGVQQRMHFLKVIRKTLKTIDPQAHLTGNPSFLRSYASRLSQGYDVALEAEVFDSICIENGNRSRFVDGTLSTQADKHLMAEAAGLRTWVTSWSAKKEGGYEPPPDVRSLWVGLAEEFSFHHAYLGNNWALRPLGDAEGLWMDSPLWGEFQKAMRYFCDLDEILAGETFRQWGELALYVDTRTLSFCPASDSRILQAFMEQMLLRRIPFKIIFQGQNPPPETCEVLIAGQRSLSSSELNRFTESGLCLLGDCALFDEWMIWRGTGNRRRLLKRKNINIHPFPLAQWLGQNEPSAKHFQGHSLSFSAEGRKQLAGFFDELTARQSIRITAPEGVLANVEISTEGRLLIHLRDLRQDSGGVRGDEVQLSIRAKILEAEGFSPEWTPGMILEGTYKDQITTMYILDFQHYAAMLLQPVMGQSHAFCAAVSVRPDSPERTADVTRASIEARKRHTKSMVTRNRPV